ncbi:MAG: hypothetical protein ABH886_11260 [Candidatus Desantisbacteria bacterium]
MNMWEGLSSEEGNYPRKARKKCRYAFGCYATLSSSLPKKMGNMGTHPIFPIIIPFS